MRYGFEDGDVFLVGLGGYVVVVKGFRVLGKFCIVVKVDDVDFMFGLVCDFCFEIFDFIEYLFFFYCEVNLFVVILYIYVLDRVFVI